MKYYCLYNGEEQTLLSFKVERTAGRAVDNATIEVLRSKVVNLNDEVYITISPVDLSNIEGLYHFDGDFKDWTDNANHGTGTDIVFSDGIHEKYMNFNGSSSKIVIPHHAANSFGISDFSILFEIQFTSTSLMPLIDKYGNSGFNISLENGRIKIYVKNAGGTQYTYTSSYAINDGDFHHINIVRKYGVGWYIYTQGVLRDSVTDNSVLPNNIDFNINTSLTLGHSPSLGGYYNDVLDEVFWFKRELTSAESSEEGGGLDHTHTIFGGIVTDRQYSYDRITVQCEGFGRVMRDKFIEAKKYYDTAVEDIIEDLVETAGTGDPLLGTGFTYDSSWASGIILKEFVAFGQMVDIITELARSVGVDFHTTYNKLFHFEPSLTETLEWEAEVGSNIQSEGWTIKDSEIVNIVYILGGAKRYNTVKTFSATASQTEFEVDYVPTSLAVFIDPAGGTNYTEQVPEEDYEVDREGKTITFLTGQALGTSVKIEYEYDIPIFIKTQDAVSIAQYGERAKKFNAEWISNIDDARRYGNGLLSFYKQPRLIGRLKYTGIKVDVHELAVLRVIDDYANPVVDQSMDVKTVVWKYPEGITELEVGTWTPKVFEWQKEIMLRIRDLERRAAAISELRRFLQLQEQFTITDSVVVTAYEAGAFRVAEGADKCKIRLNFEQNVTDLSGNGNNGTLSGTYTYTTGFKQWGLNLDGSTGKVVLPYVNLGGDITYMIRFKLDTNAAVMNLLSYMKTLIRISATDVRYWADVDLANVSHAYTFNTGTWYTIVVTQTGTSYSIYINNVLVGSGTTNAVDTTDWSNAIGDYAGTTNLDGTVDELRIYNDDVDATVAGYLYANGTLTPQPAFIGVFDTE